MMNDRLELEAKLVFTLWGNPKLFRVFKGKINNTFLNSMEANLYYNIGLEMFRDGYLEFDKQTVELFVAKYPNLSKGFESFGGYSTYSDIKSSIKSENADGLYNSLVRYNIMTDLITKGFPVEKDYDKLINMNVDQIRRFYSYKLNETFLNETTSSVIETLEITDEDIEYVIEGQGMGYSIADTAPLLNYHTLGIHEGITFVGGASGVGKSSFVMGVLVRSWMKNNIKSCVIANEENSRKFKMVLMSMVAYELYGNSGLSRRRLKIGKLNDLERKQLEEIKNKINSSYGKNIYFVKMYGYATEEVELVVDTLSARGCKNFIYDTLKAEDSSSASAVGEMKEISKQLFMAADRNNCTIICTLQLALYMDDTRYLTHATISSSKQIVEVAGEVLLMRSMWDDECSGEKYDIEPYNYVYHPQTGRKVVGADGTPVKQKFDIPKGTQDQYMLVFLAKTRNDKKGTVLVYEVDGDYSIWKEVGYASYVSHQKRGATGR